MTMEKKRCKCGCGTVITGHPNKKFVNKKHKDKFWNEKRAVDNMTYDEYYYATSHPFDSDALGQD